VNREAFKVKVPSFFTKHRGMLSARIFNLPSIGAIEWSVSLWPPCHRGTAPDICRAGGWVRPSAGLVAVEKR